MGEAREAIGRFYQSALGFARYFSGDNVDSEPTFAYAGIDRVYALKEDRGFDFGLAGLVSFMSRTGKGRKGGSLHHYSDVIRVHNPHNPIGRDIEVDKENCPEGMTLIRYVMEVARVSRNVASRAVKKNGGSGKRKGRRKRH